MRVLALCCPVPEANPVAVKKAPRLAHAAMNKRKSDQLSVGHALRVPNTMVNLGTITPELEARCARPRKQVFDQLARRARIPGKTQFRSDSSGCAPDAERSSQPRRS